MSCLEVSEEGVSEDFLCPISCILYTDPVIADDDRTYDRTSIENWFDACSSRGLPITSPYTRNEISRNLRQDVGKVKALEALQGASHEKTFGDGLAGVTSIHELRSVFLQLDGLRDVLVETLQEWQPPQLVVVGTESSGKSSLLERLVMMPIFPTDEDICTRLPIHVRLRNSPNAEAPRLEVYNVSTKETEEGPFMIPACSGAFDVQEKMAEILAKEGPETAVSLERIIILHITGPLVPSIDLIDMPGLRSTPAEMRDKTRKLLQDHHSRHGEYSFYLAIVPANEKPRNNLAMGFVEDNKLEQKTFGVYTKCDELTRKKLEDFKLLMGDSQATKLGGVTLSPHGWFATMNAPIHIADASNFKRLRKQAREENRFFQESLPDLLNSGRAGCAGLVKALSKDFLDHLRKSWLPRTMEKLHEAVHQCRLEHAALGLPAPPSNQATLELRKAMVAAIKKGIEPLFQRCCRQVLAPLQEQLAQAAVGKLQKFPAHMMKDAFEQPLQRVTAVYSEGLYSWQAIWEEGAREMLTEPPAEIPKGETAGQRLLKSPPVRPGRFPALAQRVSKGTAAAVQERKKAIEAEAKQVCKEYFKITSGRMRMEWELQAELATVTVEWEAKELPAALLALFVQGGTVLMKQLGQVAEKAVAEVSDWSESCAAEREALLQRLRKAETAMEGLSKLLGAEDDSGKITLTWLCQIDATSHPPDLQPSGVPRRLEAHTDLVECVAFSPDGTSLASASSDKTIILWDIATAAPRATLRDHTGEVYAVGFSPDGKTLASGSEDRTIKLWDVSTAKCRTTLCKSSGATCHTYSVRGLAFSPDGRTLASASMDDTVMLWDVGSAAHRATLRAHTETVKCVAFSPDGAALASGSDDKSLILWDVAAALPRATLMAHMGDVNGISFSPDGRILASCSDDNMVMLWDVGSAALRATLAVDTCSIRSVAFSPDGGRLAVGHCHKVVVWNMRNLSVCEDLNTSLTYSLAFSPDGSALAAGGHYGVMIWK